LVEVKPGQEAILIYDLKGSEPDFGEKGRIAFSEKLISGKE
jgi:hypothetical protein